MCQTQIVRHNLINLQVVLDCLTWRLWAGGNMAQYMAHRKGTPLDEDEARRLFQAMISAVAYAAALGITHHDLKLDNFLLHQVLPVARDAALACVLKCASSHLLSSEFERPWPGIVCQVLLTVV